MATKLQQLSAPPGQRLLIRDLCWSDFEALLTELGESRAARIAYHKGTLEIRMPLPKHEIAKSLLGDLVKILLEELEIDCECFGSTTFKRADMDTGLEPDDCFYITNHQRMRGKERLDLQFDPPPDLAIEVDVTSKTQLEAYLCLGVPELWVYETTTLTLYVLQGGQYHSVTTSPTFPDLPICDLVEDVITESQSIGRSPALRNLRKRIRTQLS